ncbi:MAG: hypothetical protein KIH08_04795 [Candidatus Freyarchaeota archaeon]|nr:hypothetical protein [Candidatus Jordarchaeia archaeon]MBS7268913.1 hypothetical protein [Candidatus Jordarchaeia archaeon]MBS7279627.1 hypothetical protein [Candidatus Jordarchaeia archaeon]
MSERPTGVTILAILMILYGILTLVGGFLIGIAGAVPFIGISVTVFIYVIWGIIYIIGGLGLFSLRDWARILAIIINVLGLIGGIILTITIVSALIGIPMIIISIIIIWYLTKEDVKAYFT